jgi:hypothetical protein
VARAREPWQTQHDAGAHSSRSPFGIYYPAALPPCAATFDHGAFLTSFGGFHPWSRGFGIVTPVSLAGLAAPNETGPAAFPLLSHPPPSEAPSGADAGGGCDLLRAGRRRLATAAGPRCEKSVQLFSEPTGSVWPQDDPGGQLADALQPVEGGPAQADVGCCRRRPQDSLVHVVSPSAARVHRCT